jgi:hypothetical protein
MAEQLSVQQHRANIRRMLQEGGTEQDVNVYMQHHALTDEALQGGMVQRASDALESFGNSIISVSPQDPRTKDVPAFTGEALSGPQSGAHHLSGFLTMEDEGYGGIIKMQLGDRLLGTERDAAGHEIITYLGDDGKQHRAYINKPGLDQEDLRRGIESAVPFFIGGGFAGVGLKAIGAGLTARVLGMATTEGLVSVGQDIAAASQGSGQGVDLLKAALAMGGAGLFEGMSGPLTRMWRAVLQRNGVTPKGQLTPAGRVQAQRLGLEPAMMDERLARLFGQEMRAQPADPGELASKMRTAEFGIETTKGQRTKDPAMLGLEEEARRGLLGPQAREIFSADNSGFDARQRQQIRTAAEDQIGGSLAPNAPGRESITLGSRIKSGVDASWDLAQRTENKLWTDVGPMYPSPQAFSTMPTILSRAINQGGVSPTPDLTKSAHAMMELIDGYMTGDVVRPPYKSLGPGRADVMSLDEMRRRLLALYKSADDRTDRIAAKSIYRGFNDWIEDVAQRAAMSGNPDAAAKLWTARQFTKGMYQIFEPQTRLGKPSPTARVIAQILEDNTTPSEVISAIIGRGGPSGAPPRNAPTTLRQLRTILGNKGKDAWDDIRLAYWVNLVQDSRGQVLSPTRLKGNIDAAMKNQMEVLRTLYSPEEIATMRRFGEAVDVAAYKPPNPSGTSYELQRQRQRASGSMTKTFLQTQSKRELFSKHNVLMSRIYSMLARKLPISIFGSTERAGAKIATRNTSQNLTRKPGSSLVAPIGAIGTMETLNGE